MKNFYQKSIAMTLLFFCSTLVLSQDFSEGILILNEGLFGSPTASVSHLSPSETITNDIYSTQNGGADLGDTAQGLGVNGDFTYIVLNGSNAVRVVNSTNFELVTTITDDMENPRYIAFANGNGYVTNWGDGLVTDDDYIAVIDLATNTVTETISVVEGPEEILSQDGKLYVAHQGGFGFGNTISVIDTTDNSVESIFVGDVPSALRIDEDNLYVLCSGNPDFSGNETAGSIYIIDLDDLANSTNLSFPGLEHPAYLGVDVTYLYYTLGTAIYRMELTATDLPTDPFIDTTAQNVMNPYSLNKIGDQLYLGDALDFVTEGVVFVYEEDGTFATQYTVGLLPNGFYDTEEGVLSIDNKELISINLYPNPTSSSFRLNTTATVAVSIIDTSGRLVKKDLFNGQDISIAGLQAGIYVVQLELDGKISTQKLIVQ